MPRSRDSNTGDGVDDLRNQFIQFQGEVQRRIEEETERQLRREANMQELIVSTIIDQLKSVKEHITVAVNQEMDDRLHRFAERYEKFIRDNKRKRLTFEEEEEMVTPPNRALSTHRVNREINLSNHIETRLDERENHRRDFRTPLPHADFPFFTGDNPLDWTRKCRIYFEIHQIPEEYKTHYATLHFQDRANDWYGGYLMENDPPPWPFLMELVKRRFQKRGGRSAVDEFKRLYQVEHVEEYIDKFEGAKSKLLLENRHLTESFFVDAFISGLKEKIQPLVRAFKPEELTDAYELSLHIETASENQCKKMRNSPKAIINFNTHTRTNFERNKLMAPKADNAGTSTRNTLIDQRRALGLCYKCGEKYYPGHQCKVKVHMLLGDGEEELEAIPEWKEEVQITPDQMEGTVEAIVSVHATSNNPNLKCMKFKGQIEGKSVYALMDSGSTHSFIDPAVLQGLNCTIVITQPMVVTVANGAKMVTDAMCKLPFDIQDHNFVAELRLLQVNGYDMILGLDWLSKFRPMKIDWFDR